MGKKQGDSGTEPTISAEASAPTLGADASAPTVSADAVGETLASVRGGAAPLARGATLGRYVVLGKLGGGGMGVVYTAYDPELDRRIAIKLLRPSAHAPSADARTRLLREAQALARLSHPNVIAVHDVGVVEDQVFVAMEYVAGETLHAWVKREPRTWQQICDTYVQAGRGLAAAHAVGIVHRDFKPENVLAGDDGRVRVLDFGLAREDEAVFRPDPATKVQHAETLAASQPGLATPLTGAGEFLGTPAYSSPEQLHGEPADARSDQFSFCVALYEALYGARPYAGGTFGELVANVLDGTIAEPPARTRVPGWLRATLLRGLRGKPEERFGSMDELLAELARDPASARRRVVAGIGALVLAGIASYAFFGHTRSTTAPCQGAAAKLAGIWNGAQRAAISQAFLATGKAVAPVAFDSAARSLDSYGQQWTAMSTEACVATRVRGEQSDEMLDLREFCLAKRLAALQATTQLFAHADGKIVENAGVMAQRLPSLADCADVEQLRAVVKPPSDPAVRAKVQELERAIATARQLSEAEKLTDASAALPSLEAAVALHYRPVEASLLLARGHLEYQRNDLKRSVATLDDGLVAAEAAGDDRLAMAGWIDLMGDFADMRELDDARLAGRHASALLERVGGDPRLEAKVLEYQGWIEAYEAKDGSAYFKRALELREHALAPDDPDLLESQEIDARMLVRKQQFAQALAAQQHVLAIREHLYGPDAPMVSWSLAEIASLQGKLGDAHAAISSLSRALTIYEHADVKEAGPIIYLVRGLALAHARVGDRDAALEFARRAVTLGEQLAQTREPGDLAGALATYASVLRLLGEPAQAAVQAQRALDVDGKLPTDSGLLVEYLTELGLDLLAAGRAADALAPLEHAVKLVDARVPADNWNNDQPAQARFALARVLRALARDDARARDLAAKARAFWTTWGKGKAGEVAQVDTFLGASR